ncbi:putative o-methyltransferase protein [Botrytis fragariae]|uniref:Putative o-methyltransferase protein n=1 Tax=Botrytis fragariae TaxID=1964551 RepID=A0A8H6AN83_9HELO|nr:putative o-methyltransferase protein [Botrytis fragariae]KAF5870622.1 putative o-methyltransferase protein [Botrytis fragariae]
MANAFEILSNLRDSLPADTPENQNEREKSLREVRNVSLSLERQDNAVEKDLLPVAADLGIFELLENTSSKTAADITERTPGADLTLICRVLRCLESFGAIGGNISAGYTSSTVSKASPGWLLIPQFLKDKQYPNPTSSTDTPFAKAYGFKDGATIWQILETTDHMPVIGLLMQSFNDGHKNFLDMYPAMDRLAAGALIDSEAVMMVDVGGGQGHQAIAMKRKFPDLPGRYIVTDLAHGLPVNRDDTTGVEFLVHDFMTELPIKGARLYYLRHISHDWPQAVLIQILNYIRRPMKTGYSKMIINDWMVPAEGASKYMMAQDFNMMAVGGGMERTQALHEEYIAAAGLKISGIWKANDDISENFIECEIA